MRIGLGYDVHRLVYNRDLIIGGVSIPYEKGLLGHSDADVLIHSVMDAILGALALGDIGKLFPDTSLTFKDANSMKLLLVVVDEMKKRGYRIGNIDATIIAEAPKMSSHILNMRKNISEVLKVSIDQVSIKATTEEGLGFTGVGEGIAAQSICLLEKES